MEKLIKKPSELVLGETYKFYFKRKPIEEAFDFIEGIVDLVNKQKVRIVGVFKNNRCLKLIEFSSFLKVLKADYDILLPKEIMTKSLIEGKKNFDNNFVSKEKKIQIKNALSLLHKGRKIRYFFPSPISQEHLYTDCLVKEVFEDGFLLQGFDATDGNNFIIHVRKDSNCLIQFLNKNVKLPNELKEEFIHFTKEDYKIFENIVHKKFSPHKKNLKKKLEISVSNKKPNKEAMKSKNSSRNKELEKVKKALAEKKKIKKSN